MQTGTQGKKNYHTTSKPQLGNENFLWLLIEMLSEIGHDPAQNLLSDPDLPQFSKASESPRPLTPQS